MAILWAENTYHFPTYLANAYCIKTNLPVTTSMRAPGVVQVRRRCHPLPIVLSHIHTENHL